MALQLVNSNFNRSIKIHCNDDACHLRGLEPDDVMLKALPKEPVFAAQDAIKIKLYYAQQTCFPAFL